MHFRLLSRPVPSRFIHTQPIIVLLEINFLTLSLTAKDILENK